MKKTAEQFVYLNHDKQMFRYEQQFSIHAWGLYNHKCTREEYKGNTIILHIEAKERQKCCPRCNGHHLVKNGYRFRDFIGLPVGGRKVIIRRKSSATSAGEKVVATTS